MSDSERLLERIYHDHSQGRLLIPNFPEAVHRLRQALDDPGTGTAAAAALVKADPALTALLVRVANSPLCHGTTRITDIERAVTRVGIKTLHHFVTVVAVRELFKAKNPRIAERLHEVWREGTEVAAIAAVLARQLGTFNPERALIAGLVHNIGELPVLRYADELLASADTSMLDEAIDRFGAELGTVVLQRWGFDEELAGIPVAIDNLDRETGASADYTDLVQMASIHRLFLLQLPWHGPAITTLPAFRRLALDRIGPEGSVRAVLEAKADVQALIDSLHG